MSTSFGSLASHLVVEPEEQRSETRVALSYARCVVESDSVIADQLRGNAAAALTHGYSIKAEFTDNGFSGRTLERPGFMGLQRAIAALNGVPSRIYMRDRTRIARALDPGTECKVLLDWERHGVEVRYHDSPDDVMLFAPWISEIEDTVRPPAAMKQMDGGRDSLRVSRRFRE